MNERFFRIFKKLLGILIRPTLTGASNLPQDPAGIVYVLYHQSVTDLAISTWAHPLQAWCHLQRRILVTKAHLQKDTSTSSRPVRAA